MTGEKDAPLNETARQAALIEGSNIADEYLVRKIVGAYLAALPDHIVEANKMVAAPAEMSGVEEIARAIYERRNGHGCKPWSLLTKAHKEPYLGDAEAAHALFAPILAEKERRGRREVWEVSNQLGGYIGPNTPDDLVAFLSRESDAAADLAQRVIDAEARALAAEAALAAAVEALAPFADEKNGVMQDLLWGDQPDSATMTITCPLGQVRKARETVRAAAIRAQGE